MHAHASALEDSLGTRIDKAFYYEIDERDQLSPTGVKAWVGIAPKGAEKLELPRLPRPWR